MEPPSPDRAADAALELRVAAAIGGSGVAGRRRLVVRAALGHVRIGGIYPSPEAREELLRLAAAVPGVIAAVPVRASDLAPLPS